MFKNKFVLLTLLVTGLLYTGCGERNKVTPPPKLSFNISNASALGAINSGVSRSASSSRAADDDDDYSKFSLERIMEDGTLESAFSCHFSQIDGLPEEDANLMTHWGTLKDIFLPPEESGLKDVYLYFDSVSYLPAEDQERPGHIHYWHIGSIICIHPDNTWTDVVYDSPWENNTYEIYDRHDIQLTEDGCIYYLFRGGWQFFIKKYDPSTNEKTTVCDFRGQAPLFDETEDWTEEQWKEASISVDKMRISKDGKYAYIGLIKNSVENLHIVNLETMESKDIPIFFGFDAWDYDEATEKLYYVKEIDEEMGGMFSVYSTDSSGSNEEKICDGIICNNTGLMVVGKNKVWKRYTDRVEGDENDSLIFEDIFNHEKKMIPVTSDIGYAGDYVLTDDALYLRYAGYEEQNLEWVETKGDILKISINDDTIIRYSDFLEEGNNIQIKSWNVSDTKLYISGNANDSAVSYAIDLNGSNLQKVGGDKAFTCIGGLR